MKKYIVDGMSCAACSARVEKAVSSISGVEGCTVNLLTGTMTVKGKISDEVVINAVKKAGYSAHLEGKDFAKPPKTTNTTALIMRLTASVFFLLILMYVSMGHIMWGFPLPSFFEETPAAVGILQLLLTTVVLIINQKFFINGFKALFKLSPNMDTLVALGSAAAFIYSVIELFLLCSDGDHLHLHNMYFESSAMIVTLITVGKMLESYSKGKTTDALKGLLSIAPKTADVIRNSKEMTISVDEVIVGDIFTVKAGQSVPVDAVIIDGSSAIDESALTGESVPADKTKGDNVFAGTISKSGFLTCKATKVGKDTTLSKVIEMVSDASSSKAPIARVADKVSGIFVPFVIMIAVITFAVWMLMGQGVDFALARGISVLVISCPCALGLATPVAIMVGSGVGAKNGILFKTASVLENAGKTQIVVLDKTKKCITIFKLNDYGALLIQANTLTRNGDYEAAFPYWEEILTIDRCSQVAYSGIAKTYYAAGDYENAMKFAEMGYDYSTYSLSYDFVRREFIEKNIYLFAGIILVVAVAIVLFVMYKRKKNLVIIKNRELQLLSRVMLHPSEVITEIKEKKRGSVLIGFILIVLYYITATVKETGSGFLFKNPTNTSFNSLLVLLQTFGIVILWTICNWAVCTLQEGKGKMREIFIVTSYSIIPLIISNIVYTVASNVILESEASFLSIFVTVMQLFTAFILITGTIIIHDYTFGRFVGTSIMSILGILIVIFLGIVIVILIQQVIMFVGTVYREFVYR